MSNLRAFLIALAIILFISLTSIVTIYTDFLWFNDVGYENVFTKTVVTKILTGLVFGGFFWIFVTVNIVVARRLAPKLYYLTPKLSFRAVIQQIKPYVDKYFTVIFLFASLTLAFIIGVAMSTQWELWLKYFNQVSAGVKDPIFKLDISFYLFSLPALESLIAYFFTVILLTAIISIAIHFLDGAIVPDGGNDMFAPHVKAHLSWLAALLALDLAGYWTLKIYNLLYSPTGNIVFGASYTDVNATMPALRILIVISIIAAVLFLVNIYFRGLRLPLIAIGMIGVTWIFAANVYPAFVQSYSVAPNELSREKPYIKNNIAFTRKAYNLDKISEHKFPALNNLEISGLAANQGTLENVRLWDWQPLKKTYSQIQEIRLYYMFNDVDLDRYTIDDNYRQVTLSARELSTEKLPETAKTWINEHLVFTHGYGAVMSPVNEVSPEGLPKLFIKNIPPVSSTDIKITQPAIYYGEKTDNYIITNSNTREFDYPKGDKNQYTTYDGSGGIKATSLAKAAFTLRFSSLKLLFSDEVTPKSRIHFRRNIMDRVERIAPFLRYDGDPYLVIDDGKLYWFIDAFTLSSRYPYSNPFNGRDNYIRNSVKVVIDAYNGTTDFYVVDKDDPVIATYDKIFPSLFKPFDEMPESFREHIRYPETLFTIQANMYTVFHMKDTQVFYNKEDMWSLPEMVGDTGKSQIEPYYVIMKLPGEDTEEFLLLQPFTPKNKNNMIAWMAARNDIPDYGEIRIYNFPKDKLVFGPTQIEARIDQNPEISRQLSLWNQRGSKVVRGNLLVIPIEESIIYVQPLYLQSEKSELPELKRVLVGYGNKVAMEETLEEALAKIFVAPARTAPSEDDEEDGEEESRDKSVDELIEEAADHFNKAQAASENGDWAEYGKEINKLEDILKKLQSGG